MTTPEQDRIFSPEQDARLRQQLLRLAPAGTDLWPAIAPQLEASAPVRRFTRRKVAVLLAAAALLAALLLGAALLRRWAVYNTATGQLTLLPEGDGYHSEGTAEDGSPYTDFAPVPSWQMDADEETLPEGTIRDENGNLILPETDRTRLLDSAEFGQAVVDVQGSPESSITSGAGLEPLESNDREQLLAAWPWEDAARRMADALPEDFRFSTGTVLPYATREQLEQAELVRLEQGEDWAVAIFDLPREVKRQGSALRLTYTGPDGAQVRFSTGLSSDCELLITGGEDLQAQPLELDGFVSGTKVTRRTADGLTETKIYLWQPMEPVTLDGDSSLLVQKAARAADAGPDTLLGLAAQWAKSEPATEQCYLSYSITAVGLSDAQLDALLDALAG